MKATLSLWGRTHLPEIIVLLVAALVRFWRLDYHSIWLDEAISLRWARSDVSYIWASTFPLVKDKHPPVYYLLLHFWSGFLDLFGLGRADAALRSLGSLLGVLTVLGILLLAGRLSGRAAGLLAGLLVAVSPVLVWYSQELRMFQPATAALVWAAYCLLRGWQGGRWSTRLGWWIGFVVAMELALYSYLFSAFMLPAAALALVALLLTDRKNGTRMNADERGSEIRVHPRSSVFHFGRFLEGIVAIGVAGVLFLPLARNAWLANANDGTPGQLFMDFLPNLQRQLQIFTLWRVDWPAPWVTAALFFLGVLVLLGVLLPWPARTVRPAPRYLDQLWLLIWIGAPLLLGNLLLAKNDTVFAEDRYFLFLAPFVLWAAARGAVVAGKCGGDHGRTGGNGAGDGFIGRVSSGGQPPRSIHKAR